MRHIVVIGANSEIAKACIVSWAKQEQTFFSMVSRDRERYAAFSSDLTLRFPETETAHYEIDFLNSNSITTLANNLSSTPIDIVLIAHGVLPDQAECEIDISLCKRSLEVNAISPVLFSEVFLHILLKQNFGALAVIGSVAGDRGRKSNYIYGAAKALISSYMSGVTHRLAKSPVTITLIKPGPVDTPMTNKYRETGLSMASPDEVANDIVRAISKGERIVYTPRKWQIVMLVIKLLPNFIFSKLNI
jgi:short-subunit dehydrogenase